MKLVASSLTDDRAVLRARLADDGYVYFQRAIDTDVLDRLRSAARRAAIAAHLMSRRGQLAERDLAARTKRSAALLCAASDFRAARYAPSLRTVTRIFGASKPHPAPHAAFARFVLPREKAATMPAHQDQHYLPRRYEFITLWIPVLMPDANGGGVAIARGSHAKGRIEHAGGRIAREPKVWCSAAYHPGDVVVFTGYTVHKSLANHASSLRVSVDYRYVVAT